MSLERVAAAVILTAAEEGELSSLESRLYLHHDRIELARTRNVPDFVLLHAARLFNCQDVTKWSAANATLFQFESRFGIRKLMKPCENAMFSPQISSGKKKK